MADAATAAGAAAGTAAGAAGAAGAATSDWVETWLGPTVLGYVERLAVAINERPYEVLTTVVLALVPLLTLSVIFSYLLLRELDKAEGRPRTPRRARTAPAKTHAVRGLTRRAHTRTHARTQ